MHLDVARGALGPELVSLGGCSSKWVGAELPFAPVRHSSYGEGLPGRGKVRLWKAIRDGHVLRVDAGWWKADHLQSSLGPFRDAVAVVE